MRLLVCSTGTRNIEAMETTLAQGSEPNKLDAKMTFLEERLSLEAEWERYERLVSPSPQNFPIYKRPGQTI